MPVSGYQYVVLLNSFKALYIVGELVKRQFSDKLLGKAFNIAVKRKADKNRNLQGILCHDGRSVYSLIQNKVDAITA